MSINLASTIRPHNSRAAGQQIPWTIAGEPDWFSWGDIDTVSISHPAVQEVAYGYNWSGPLYVFYPTLSYKDW